MKINYLLSMSLFPHEEKSGKSRQNQYVFKPAIFKTVRRTLLNVH
jgi:hypothetical protein